MKKEKSKYYISDIEKKGLENELLPNGIFYFEVNHSFFDSILKRLDSQFETINDYADTLNKAIYRNCLIFRQSLNGLNRAEVMDAIKVQYSYYKETCNNMSHWLKATKDLIVLGLYLRKELSKEIQSDFNTWYDNELKLIIKDYLKNDLENEFNSWKIELNNPLATELQFLNDKKNECEKAINRAKELNIKLFHGKPSFLLYKETNELTKLEIINERINELSKPQQSNEVIESIEPINEHENIFVNGYAYKLFLEWHDKFKDNEKNHKANYSYLIRSMIIDKLIFELSLGAYLDFLKDYKVIIDRIKTLAECRTNAKDTIYLDTKNTINIRYNQTI